MGKHRLFVAALLLGTLCCGAIALASVDLSAGIRYVSPSGTLADCSAKAKAAIEAYLPGATEAEAGSGEWMATAQNPATGAPSAAAAVRCYPLPKGYVATFLCSVQLPLNPYGASALCLDVAHKILWRSAHAACVDAESDSRSERLRDDESRRELDLRRQPKANVQDGTRR